KAMRPVKLRVPMNEWMHDHQRYLRVTKFIHGTERRHRTPRAVSSKATAPEIADHCREFRQWEGRRMQLESVHPDRWQFLKILEAAAGFSHGINGRIFLMLVFHIFRVGGAKGLVPVFPLLMAQPGRSTDGFRKDLLLGDIREVPVHFSGKIEPL